MRRTLLLVAVLATVCIACGLPSDSAPRQIADDKVPFELLGPSTTQQPSNVGSTDVKLFFLDGEQLKAVDRRLPDDQPATVLGELVKGVIESDPTGVASAIPKDTQVVNVTFEGDTLVITLSAAMLSIGDPGQRNAFAQFVYTATELHIPSVRFRVVDANGGNPQDVHPTTDVAQKPDPLTRSDFAQLAPK